MSPVLVDSNVILDVLTGDPRWFAWSSGRLAQMADTRRLVINPIVYSEVSVRFRNIEDLDEAVPESRFDREPITSEAAFLAGKAFLAYRRTGGPKLSPLPDFFIGAHAATAGYAVLTRDVRRYRTYFPRLALIAPD